MPARFTTKALLICHLILIGCTPTCDRDHADMDPEEVVKAYLEVAINFEELSDRKYLMQYTTGTLKDALAGASIETIRAAYIETSSEITGFKIIDSFERTLRETEVSFLLTYDDQVEEAEKPVSVSTENTVTLIKENGAWYIRDINGSRTTFDFPPTEIKATKP